VSKVLKVGGAQAIAALAFGTSTIPRVDKIVGPGNLFVTLAKKRVFGSVGIDALHGPTETMLIADGHASPVYCAADMLAQAEHDPQASSILLTTSRELAVAVAEEIEQQLGPLERGAVARASIEANGAIVVVSDLNTAVDIANEYAPEHLCLLVEDPFRLLPLVKNAGGVFLGESSFEVMGDYVAGPSHTMPTGGTARFSSALNVDDFVKTTSVVALDEAVMRQLGEAAALLARSEGLTAHAHAVDVRMQAAEHARVVRRAGGQ
jgi:histidinol dehydrogenase